MPKHLSKFLSGLLTLLLLCCASAKADEPTVGTIRWDAWFTPNQYEKFLADPQWHYRLPFYAEVISSTVVYVREDKQEIMDQEIASATAAGLDYLAFCYRPFPQDHKLNLGKSLYLASPLKNQINFCLILMGHGLGPIPVQNFDVQAAWKKTVQDLVKSFQEKTYQKVLGERPLFYVFSLEYLEKHFGSWEQARKAFDELRTETLKAGLKSPYIVAMTWLGSENASYLETVKFDAVSGYSAPIIRNVQEQTELPYADLAEANRDFWTSVAAAGKKVIPVVNTGWDDRPRWIDPNAHHNKGPWFKMPTPDEIAQNLKAGMLWVKENPDAAETQSVLIYAWNEPAEGGWLQPTKSEGTARLDAIGKLLRKKNKK